MAQYDAYSGKQIGNYRISRKLASGGFGSVYLAQHVILAERMAVIKVLHALHLSSEGESENFLREAQFLEKLKHPFILPILDVGLLSEIDQHVPYLVAEYAPNGSLRQLVERYASQPLPLAQATSILSQIGQALQHAHQQNIIHRDLKPENILFNAKDEALLADFGIATALQTASVKFTRVIGTPSYMAPEQFQGMVSKETDQYALACIAFELYTGKRPFVANDTMAIMYKHLNEYPPAPRQLNPQLPSHIEAAILKGLAKDRMQRFPSISAFVDALHASQTLYTPPEPLVSLNATATPIAPPPPPVSYPYGISATPGPAYANNTPPYSSQPQLPPPPRYGYQPQPFQIQMFAPDSSQTITPAAKSVAGWSYLAPFLISIPFSLVFPLVHLIYWLIVRNTYTVKSNRFAGFHFIQAMLINLWADIGALLFVIAFSIASTNYTANEYACTNYGNQNACSAYHAGNAANGIIFLIACAFYLFIFIQWLRGVIAAFSGRYVQLPIFGKRAEARLHKRAS